ncbi:Orotate phosphoribosyltransferase [Planctomycetes bacterium Poly30]|uniref:Orotate phosphoribosyltransferase n=1 Tax=Saltatorellus ferox TaxID=2528018 RepID=A0A518EQ57_9BACT|nr:Orotate phosphoribosyltransferase [Planctomycetes bacterium Poly30]
MSANTGEFIDFMCESGVLTFGDFVTKSGRPTPYFVNTGRYTTGGQMSALGAYYASALEERFHGQYDVLFGPAYKGIPLAVSIAEALFRDHGLDVPFCFNRKEAKGHGEGGVLVGHPLRDGDRVLIVEDVTTAGTSIRETVPILKAAADVRLAGLIVSVDRMERGRDEHRSALEEVGLEFGMPTQAIVNVEQIIERLRPEGDSAHRLDASDMARIETYRAKFGVRAPR